MDLLIFENDFAKLSVKEKGPIGSRAFFRRLEWTQTHVFILDKPYIFAQAQKGICL